MPCGPVGPDAIVSAHLDVDRSPANVILRAQPIPGAARYRFPWSHDPASAPGSPTSLLSDVPETRHGVLTDGLNYFYLVQDASPDGCP